MRTQKCKSLFKFASAPHISHPDAKPRLDSKHLIINNDNILSHLLLQLVDVVKSASHKSLVIDVDVAPTLDSKTHRIE